MQDGAKKTHYSYQFGFQYIYFGRYLLIVAALLVTACSAAYASYPHHATHFYQIRGDYIYTALPSGYFKKIEKDTGRVVWTNRGGGGQNTQPVFHDGHFLVIEMYRSELISVDCETGEPELVYQYSFGCCTAEAVLDPTVYDDLLIAFSSSDIQALHLSDRKLAWEFTCRDRDLVGVFDYFQIGDSLYVLAMSLADESLRRKDAPPLLVDKSPRELEIIKLDCSTGEALKRFGKELFFGDVEAELETFWEIGDWNGKRLIVVGRSFGSDALSYSLFGFDPATESAVMLVEQLDFPPYAGKTEFLQWYEFKPVTAGDLIFYVLGAEDEEPMLVAKSLTNGETVWTIEKGKTPIAATDNRVFTLSFPMRRFNIFCRDALTGDLVWSKKFKRFQGSGPYEAISSDDYLYFMSAGFLHKLDVETGDEVWRVELEKRDSSGYEDDSILDKIYDYLSEIF